jgi:acyl carrier protein
VTTQETIRDLITENVEGFDGSQLKPGSVFLEAGLDSLDLATVFLEIQEMFDVVIAEGDEDQYDTLEKLVAYVENSKSQ